MVNLACHLCSASMIRMILHEHLFVSEFNLLLRCIRPMSLVQRTSTLILEPCKLLAESFQISLHWRNLHNSTLAVVVVVVVVPVCADYNTVRMSFWRSLQSFGRTLGSCVSLNYAMKPVGCILLVPSLLRAEIHFGITPAEARNISPHHAFSISLIWAIWAILSSILVVLVILTVLVVLIVLVVLVVLIILFLLSPKWIPVLRLRILRKPFSQSH